MDGQTARYIEQVLGVQRFLDELRERAASRGPSGRCRSGSARYPSAAASVRRLGIPPLRDRVVQAALKLVLEPIFEADFKPCSYGFRPRRRAQDAIAEIHFLTTHSLRVDC